jgi:hypothetical protein
MIDILWVCVYENHKTHKILSEWVSDCCLTPVEQFFSCIMVRTSYSSMRWWCLLCTKSTGLVGLLIVLAHLNNSPGVDMVFYSNTLYPDSEPISLFPHSLSLVLCAKRKVANTNFIVFGLVWPDQEWDSKPWSTALETSTITITIISLTQFMITSWFHHYNHGDCKNQGKTILLHYNQ